MLTRMFENFGRLILVLSFCCLPTLTALTATAISSDLIDETATNSTTFLSSRHPAESRVQALAYAPGKTLSASAEDGDRSSSPNALAPGTEGCCDSDFCDAVPCCKLCPCTYGWLEGLVLWRNNQAANQVLVSNLNSGQALLSMGDLAFNGAGGFRAGFGIRDCCGIAWEFNYFGVFNQNASASVTGNNDLQLPGSLGLAVNNFFGADFANVQYTSQLNNAEINRVCCCCCCDCPTRCRSVEWLYGVRYLNLSERFALTATDLQESTSTYRIHTYNNLIGGQVGTRLRRCFGAWSWEATGKAGIFGNAAQQTADPITDFPNQFLIRPARSTSGGQVAFVGDLNFTGIYQIDSTWGLRAGYNLIWIEGVALAPNQLDFTNTPTSGMNLSSNGGVFLHGLSAGLEARW